jgi:hypothetical protein
MISSRVVAIGVLRALALAIGCSPTVAAAEHFTRTAFSGETTRMFVYHSVNGDCIANSGIVKVTTRPSHGKLTNHIVRKVIRRSRFGTDQFRCSGAMTKGFQVDYRSAPGFRGTDNFSLEMRFGSGRVGTDEFTVFVE